jgi:elongation factor Ts
MGISAASIKQLREETGAGVLDCRKALEACGGDAEKAKAWLKEKGLASAAKKTDRVAADGLVGSYIHHNHRVAVLVEVNCETDFVARTEGFKTLTQNIAKHIAMANPQYLKPEDVPGEKISEIRHAYRNQAAAAGTSEDVIDGTVAKQIETFYKENCLLNQPYALDEKVTIGDMITQAMADLKENIVVRRFVRYELGA